MKIWKSDSMPSADMWIRNDNITSIYNLVGPVLNMTHMKCI